MKTTVKTGVLRHSDARALAAELAGALDAGDATLDLAGVDQIDTGILQVLVSASTLADRTGRRLHLHMPQGCAVWQASQALALPRFGHPVTGGAAAVSNKGQSL